MNAKIDIVRCIMNYMIVVLHAWAAFQYVQWGCGEFVVWNFICSHLAAMAMPTFFLISGYLLFQNFSMNSWPDKMKRRVRRLVVPYFAWNILFVLFYLGLSQCIPRLATRVSTFGLDSVCGAISKIASFTVAPIDGPLWFLRVLFILALFSPLIWAGMRVWRGWFMFTLSLVWCLGEWALGLSHILHLTAPAYAIACFVLGGVLAKNGNDIIVVFSNWKWIVLGVGACILQAGLTMPSLIAKTTIPTTSELIIPFLTIFKAPTLLAVVALLPIEGWTDNRIFNHFRKISFFVYAGHFLFCSVWLHAIAPHLGGYWVGKFSALVMIFIIGGMVTMEVVYHFAKRYVPKAFKIFDGTL